MQLITQAWSNITGFLYDLTGTTPDTLTSVLDTTPVHPAVAIAAVAVTATAAYFAARATR